MKIVILDGYTTNPGDLSWDFLNEFVDRLAYLAVADDAYGLALELGQRGLPEAGSGVRYNHNQQDAYRRPDDSRPAGAQVHHSAEHVDRLAYLAVADDAYGLALELGQRGLPEAEVRAAAPFAAVDRFALHCPLTPQTTGLVNAEFIAKMKPNAFLINTSRGPVVDEQALADALKSGRISGAGVDVLSTEPPKESNPLLGCENCLITPHIAWAGFETRTRLVGIVEENLRAFVKGEPINVVNK